MMSGDENPTLFKTPTMSAAGTSPKPSTIALLAGQSNDSLKESP